MENIKTGEGNGQKPDLKPDNIYDRNCMVTDKGNEMGEEIFADIIIDISHEALDKVFQYRVPFSLRGQVVPGVRVCVPFGAGNREKEGYVIALTDQPDYDVNKIKEILRIAEGSLTVESQLIQVAAFLKKRYGSSMLQALKTVMPVKIK